DRHVLDTLLGFNNALASLDISERLPLLIGFASVIEAVSGVRKDGRALRIEPNKQRADLETALQDAWARIADDIAIADQYYAPTSAVALIGDGRTLTVEGETHPSLTHFDLIIYSPP